ncbi:hypothetical protein [Butyricimonas faecihominis]|uniref:hypothetical protein n=1 Tax=Butyricimonas faecihominis TaxID=1472416 RepID=UPI00266FE21C|nr:hypothetical protein [Butyricimonas faecihominis]
MATISSKTMKNVWKYIYNLPRDLGFNNKVDVVYEEHCSNLNITEFDLRDILIEFEKRHFVTLERYIDGTFVTFLR